jgi:hypothetical protein
MIVWVLLTGHEFGSENVSGVFSSEDEARRRYGMLKRSLASDHTARIVCESVDDPAECANVDPIELA